MTMANADTATVTFYDSNSDYTLHQREWEICS